jgi:hypothetical protein
VRRGRPKDTSISHFPTRVKFNIITDLLASTIFPTNKRTKHVRCRFGRFGVTVPVNLPELLTCPKCLATATKWRRDRKFDWARALYCSCGRDWLRGAEDGTSEDAVRECGHSWFSCILFHRLKTESELHRK